MRKSAGYAIHLVLCFGVGLLLPHMPAGGSERAPQDFGHYNRYIVDVASNPAETMVSSSVDAATSGWGIDVSDAIALLAVVVALFLGAFGDRLKAWVNPPKLTLKLTDHLGDMTNSGGVDGSPRIYFHLSVDNKNRMTSIHDVQVCLLDVIVELDGHDPVHGYAGPIPLAWRHNLGGGDGTNPRSIGAPHEVDLFNVGSNDLRLAIPLRKDVHGNLTGAPFRLPSYILTNIGAWAGDGRAQFDQSLTMRVFAQARGTEADSDVIEVQLTWNMAGPNHPDLGIPLPEVAYLGHHQRLPETLLEGRRRDAPQIAPRSRRLYWGGRDQPLM